ncbi:MAG: hypothetical protein KJN66_03245, partial [Bacteroidia bacterium]|nr:hypothetical protein [Bacteroidia bacterium]
DVPIKKLDVRLVIPDSLNYRTKFNSKSSIISKVEKTSRLREVGSDATNQNKVKDITCNSISESVIIITDSNVPSLKEEPFANVESYRAKLSLEFDQLETENISKPSASWDELSSYIHNKPGFGGQLVDYEFFKDDVISVLNGTEDPFQKAALLFNYVKLKIKWNGLKGYLTQKGIINAYNSGKGNIADINLTLLSMLRFSGLNADPVLVNTLNPEISSEPSERAFNYIICQVQLDDQFIFLDATDEFSSPNILPLRALNGSGRLINDDGTSSWIDLYPKKLSTNKVTLNAKINSDNTIKGEVKIQYTDYLSAKFRVEFNESSNKDIVNSIKKGQSGLNIYNLKSKVETDLSNSVNQSFEFISNKTIKKTGNKLYFSPIIFLEPDKNPFEEDTRQYAIDFKYPFENQYKINIVFPEGYTVESLPKSDMFKLNENDGEFSYYSRETGKMLQFMITFKLNKPQVSSDEYKKIKQFYKKMFDKINEKVILREINNENRKRSKNGR